MIDRVRIVEWTRRLAGIPDDTIDDAKNRNDYIQLLKIMTRGGRVHGIFHQSPPIPEIPPLAETMANVFSEHCPELPRAGPIEPIISRKTPDGRAYLAIRKIPDRGVLCYMAVNSDEPEPSNEEQDDDEEDDENTIESTKEGQDE